MGIDYGSKKVGIALSDDTESMAFPKMILVNDQMLVRSVQALVDAEKVGAIVLGDTRTESGGENDVTKDMERFASALKETVGIPVFVIPEHGTTGAAGAREMGDARGETTFKNIQDTARDARSAALILERYWAIHKERMSEGQE